MESKTPKPLIEILAAQGRNQRWLAVQCDMADSTVTRWITGKFIPGLPVRKYVESVLGHPIDWTAN